MRISSDQIRNLCEGIFIWGLVAKGSIIIVALNLKKCKKHKKIFFKKWPTFYLKCRVLSMYFHFIVLWEHAPALPRVYSSLHKWAWIPVILLVWFIQEHILHWKSDQLQLPTPPELKKILSKWTKTSSENHQLISPERWEEGGGISCWGTALLQQRRQIWAMWRMCSDLGGSAETRRVPTTDQI